MISRVRVFKVSVAENVSISPKTALKFVLLRRGGYHGPAGPVKTYRFPFSVGNSRT
jgi:hypothetical protein